MGLRMHRVTKMDSTNLVPLISGAGVEHAARKVVHASISRLTRQIPPHRMRLHIRHFYPEQMALPLVTKTTLGSSNRF